MKVTKVALITKVNETVKKFDLITIKSNLKETIRLMINFDTITQRS